MWIGEILAELQNFEFPRKISKRNRLSSFVVFSNSNISATIHPINMVPRSFWISFMSCFYWLHFIFTRVRCTKRCAQDEKLTELSVSSFFHGDDYTVVKEILVIKYGTKEIYNIPRACLLNRPPVPSYGSKKQ